MKEQLYSHTKCRLSAMIQATFGFLCVVFGIADRVEMMEFDSGFPASSAIAIWMGCLIFITGIVGFVASLPRNEKNRLLVLVYFVMSILSTLLAFIILDCYIISVVMVTKEGNCQDLGKSITMYYGTITRDAQCEIRRKIATVMIVMCVCDVLGGFLAIYCCGRIYQSTRTTCNVDEKDPDLDRLETIDDTVVLEYV